MYRLVVGFVWEGGREVVCKGRSTVALGLMYRLVVELVWEGSRRVVCKGSGIVALGLMYRLVVGTVTPQITKQNPHD